MGYAAKHYRGRRYDTLAPLVGFILPGHRYTVSGNIACLAHTAAKTQLFADTGSDNTRCTRVHAIPHKKKKTQCVVLFPGMARGAFNNVAGKVM